MFPSLPICTHINLDLTLETEVAWSYGTLKSCHNITPLHKAKVTTLCMSVFFFVFYIKLNGLRVPVSAAFIILLLSLSPNVQDSQPHCTTGLTSLVGFQLRVLRNYLTWCLQIISLSVMIKCLLLNLSILSLFNFITHVLYDIDI